MTDPFVDSLTNKTSPAPYDQLIVLSQKTINDAFYNMWALADDSSPIRNINLSTRDGETINGALNAPTVIINVVDYTCTMYFQWNFQSGTMSLYTTDDPNNPDKVNFDLKGWTVAFTTVMARDIISPKDPSYNGYVQQMGLGQSSVFSLGKLYVKSQETPGYYPEGSNFQGVDWSSQPQAVQNHFEELRAVWMTQMQNGGLTKIGVMLTTTDPQSVNASAPTFPPATIDYLTYPWKDPTNPEPPTNMLQSNALCYLIMTGKDVAPVPPALPYSGTWVDTDTSEPGRDAILCMNTNQFWESWLLPVLQAVNLATQIQPDTPYLQPYSSDGVYIGLNFIPGYSSTHDNSNDSYFQFTPASDKNGWTWTANNALLQTNNGLTNGDATWSLSQSATADTRVVFDKGGQTITITGNNSCGMATHWSAWYGSGGSTMSFTMQYTIKLVIQRVDSGGLQIINAITPTCTKSAVSWNNDNVEWPGIPLDQYGAMVQNNAFDTFSHNIQVYDNTLLTGLAGQNKLFLPGAGDYLCNKVMFNSRGDLMTNLAFNGAGSSKAPSSIPEILQDAAAFQPQATPFVPRPPQPVKSYIHKAFIPKAARPSRNMTRPKNVAHRELNGKTSVNVNGKANGRVNGNDC